MFYDTAYRQETLRTPSLCPTFIQLIYSAKSLKLNEEVSLANQNLSNCKSSNISILLTSEAVPQRAIGANVTANSSSNLYTAVRVAIPGTHRGPMPPPTYIPPHALQPSAMNTTLQGYTENHAHYHSERAQAIRQALHESNGHFVTLRIELARKRPGAKKLEILDVSIVLSACFYGHTLTGTLISVV